MPTATTEVTYDYSITGPARDAAEAQINSLLQPYKDSGVITAIPTYVPELPGSFPPAAGSYTAVRTWSNDTDAQTFVTAINAWLTSNPTPYASQFTIQIQS